MYLYYYIIIIIDRKKMFKNIYNIIVGFELFYYLWRESELKYLNIKKYLLVKYYYIFCYRKEWKEYKIFYSWFWGGYFNVFIDYCDIVV